MDTRTLAQLRTDIRQRGNYNRSAVFTDTILTRWVNIACKELYRVLRKVFGAHYYTKEDATLVSVADQDTINLPSDFLTSIAFEEKVSNEWVPVPRINIKDRPRFNDVRRVAYLGSKYGYFLRANTIVLSPIPSTVDTFRLTYVPTFTDLSADGDTFDGIIGYEEYVILRVMAMCAARDKSPDGAAKARTAEQYLKDISMDASPRDVGEPELLPDHTLGDAVY